MVLIITLFSFSMSFFPLLQHLVFYPQHAPLPSLQAQRALSFINKRARQKGCVSFVPVSHRCKTYRFSQKRVTLKPQTNAWRRPLECPTRWCLHIRITKPIRNWNFMTTKMQPVAKKDEIDLSLYYYKLSNLPSSFEKGGKLLEKEDADSNLPKTPICCVFVW